MVSWVEEEDTDAGVVATLHTHAVVLVQRSGYFKMLLLGSCSKVVEGRTKTLTVEMADETGV